VWFNFSKVKGSVTGRERRGKKSPTKPNES